MRHGGPGFCTSVSHKLWHLRGKDCASSLSTFSSLQVSILTNNVSVSLKIKTYKKRSSWNHSYIKKRKKKEKIDFNPKAIVDFSQSFPVKSLHRKFICTDTATGLQPVDFLNNWFLSCGLIERLTITMLIEKRCALFNEVAITEFHRRLPDKKNSP